MKTEHEILFSDSGTMGEVADNSVHLVVTSPPYPMIEMWDKIFALQDSAIGNALKKGAGPSAFEAMHTVLDRVWKEVFRVLVPGGFACINIGDATRTIGGEFSLFPNHARILSAALGMGFSPLPCILWRKQTNAPNKFMGSGMLPAGAYVTLEHEYVLILRKGGKRAFTREEDKQHRRESALFWEERNLWFSDVWFDIKGTRQAMGDKKTRQRSGAFPFELAYRLVNMYSVKGDLVVDPFLGTGTTALAAMAAGRHSLGYEIDPGLKSANGVLKKGFLPMACQVIRQRLSDHMDFVRDRTAAKGPLKHMNTPYGFPVMTAQEKMLLINEPLEVKHSDGTRSEVIYSLEPDQDFFEDGAQTLECRPEPEPDGQMTLF